MSAAPPLLLVQVSVDGDATSAALVRAVQRRFHELPYVSGPLNPMRLHSFSSSSPTWLQVLPAPHADSHVAGMSDGGTSEPLLQAPIRLKDESFSVPHVAVHCSPTGRKTLAPSVVADGLSVQKGAAPPDGIVTVQQLTWSPTPLASGAQLVPGDFFPGVKADVPQPGFFPSVINKGGEHAGGCLKIVFPRKM